ncbi:MAG: hypothetical protein F6J93_22060 [Oscillatoria sp. SIO1A7]|nr:hypothetical protein [Oscillatoria sp. SIO1A7]
MWAGRFWGRSWDKSYCCEKAARQNVGANLTWANDREQGLKELSNWETEKNQPP